MHHKNTAWCLDCHHCLTWALSLQLCACYVTLRVYIIKHTLPRVAPPFSAYRHVQSKKCVSRNRAREREYVCWVDARGARLCNLPFCDKDIWGGVRAWRGERHVLGRLDIKSDEKKWSYLIVCYNMKIRTRSAFRHRFKLDISFCTKISSKSPFP